MEGVNNNHYKLKGNVWKEKPLNSVIKKPTKTIINGLAWPFRSASSKLFAKSPQRVTLSSSPLHIKLILKR